MNADEAKKVHANASRMMQQVRDARTKAKAAKHDLAVLEKQLTESQAKVAELTAAIREVVTMANVYRDIVEMDKISAYLSKALNRGLSE